jgi:Tfp pilus assembly protein PilN
MRAVNLLPEKHRPRQATGTNSNASYVLLGVLGLVVAAVLVYVMTVNSINSDRTAIADAQAATAQANAQADQLGAYGDFAKVKADRVTAVKNLAQGRSDWERMVRELAHVLPDGVWIQNASAADAGSDAAAAGGSGSTGSTAAATDPAATAAASTGPALTLQGCARDQAKVAETLVRLREMQGASDVQLDHSTRPDEAAASGDSAAAAGDCGVIEGHPTYEFQMSVAFEKTQPAGGGESGNVPARLGGGQ